MVIEVKWFQFMTQQVLHDFISLVKDPQVKGTNQKNKRAQLSDSS